ncbi:MAG: hypothetical protein R2939_13125 [Kofleriaceae bacterium]
MARRSRPPPEADDEVTERDGPAPLAAISMKPPGPARARQPTPHVRKPTFRAPSSPAPRPHGVLAPPRSAAPSPRADERRRTITLLVMIAGLVVVTAVVTVWLLG